jgi:hypothetical protein
MKINVLTDRVDDVRYLIKNELKVYWPDLRYRSLS